MFSGSKSVGCFNCLNGNKYQFNCELYKNQFTESYCKSTNRILKNEFGKKPSCQHCPAGFMPDEDGLECIVCSVGHYCTGHSYHVEACPPGKNCSITGLAKISETNCGVGFNCADPTAPVQCSNGTYANENNTKCLRCEPGGFCHFGIRHICEVERCDQFEMSEAISCEKGFECRNGIPYHCNITQFNPELNGKCSTCPPGNRSISAVSTSTM